MQHPPLQILSLLSLSLPLMAGCFFDSDERYLDAEQVEGRMADGIPETGWSGANGVSVVISDEDAAGPMILRFRGQASDEDRDEEPRPIFLEGAELETELDNDCSVERGAECDANGDCFAEIWMPDEGVCALRVIAEPRRGDELTYCYYFARAHAEASEVQAKSSALTAELLDWTMECQER